MDDLQKAIDSRMRMNHAERLKAAGICTACGNAPARPGRTLCAACADRGAALQKERRAARKAAGLCVKCGKAPARPGRQTCAECAEKEHGRYAAWSESVPGCGGDCGSCPLPECTGRLSRGETLSARRVKQYDSRKAAGLCVSCGKREAAPGRAQCPPCREKAAKAERRHYEKMKAAGACTACGRAPARPGLTKCAACAAKGAGQCRERVEKRNARGLCAACGSNPARPGRRTCQACAAKEGERLRAARMKPPKAEYRIDPYGRKVPPRAAGGKEDGSYGNG